MKTSLVKCPDQLGGATRVYEVDYTDFTAAATSESLTLDGLEAGDSVLTAQCKIIVKEAFTHGTASTMSAELGVTGDTDRLIDTASAATVDFALVQSVAADNLTYSPNAAKSLLLTMTNNSGNVADYTAGKLWVYVPLNKKADFNDNRQF